MGGILPNFGALFGSKKSTAAASSFERETNGFRMNVIVHKGTLFAYRTSGSITAFRVPNMSASNGSRLGRALAPGDW